MTCEKSTTDDTEIGIVNNIGKFTAFIKVDVTFDRWNVSLSNTEDIDGSGHPVFGYNLFSINDLLDAATEGVVTEAEDIATEGAIIVVQSLWYCNFDGDSEGKGCKPRFQFQRIDGQPNTISSGFNYRSVTYDISKKRRLLEKLHGLRVIFIIEGTGSKFDLVALSTTFGAGMAYLGVATLISDLILERFLKKSKRYYANKHRPVTDDEAEEVPDEEQESIALNEHDSP